MPEPPRRKTGRPPLDPDDPAVNLNVRVPSKQYDAVYQMARASRCTVPEMVRRMMRRHLPPGTTR